MRFSVEEHVRAAPAAVIRAFADPDFYAELSRLDTIHPPEVLHHEVHGEVVRLRVRFQARVDLPGPARAFLHDDLLSWVEHSEHDLAAVRGRFEIVPEHYRSLFEASGRVDYEKAGRGSIRRMSGTVRVKVPLVGPRAEQVVVDGVRDQVGAATPIVERWIRARR